MSVRSFAMKRLFGIIILLAVCVAAVGYFGFCCGDDPVYSDYEVAATTSPLSVNVLEESEGEVSTKLFGIIEIKSAQAQKSENNEVLLGGFPLGLDLDLKGLMITGKAGVVTADGAVSPCENTDIRYGDVLLAIDGKSVGSDKAISMILNENAGESVELYVMRGDESKIYTVYPAKDVLSGNYRIGLTLQDKISGIGTATFINPQTKKYACLGHAILSQDGSLIRIDGGKIFNAYISGSVKGKIGKAGELNGTFSSKSLSIGTIEENCAFGNYGVFTGKTDSMQKIEIGSRTSVRPGKAQIYSTVMGSEPKYYDIEIIKVNEQSSPSDKSMVIRITDEKLISLTGGIVQGMSGSPIIQNGKLVGAVTHVFTADPTKGYGIYADWMYEKTL